MTSRPFYICSAGVVSAAGTGTASLVAALENPAWDAPVGLERPDGPSLPVAVCRDFSPRNVLPPLVVRRLDRPARLLAVAAREALAAVGEELPWDRQRVGVAAGTWNAGTSALVDVLRAVFLASPEEAPPAQFPSTVANAPASQLGILERLGGPNLTFAEKQASGLRALVEAARLLAHRRAVAALACGVDEGDWLNAEGYARLGALADRPGRAGMRLGEGAVVLTLAPEPTGTPLARLAGWASAGSASQPWLYPDRPDALAGACQRALEAAGCAPSDVDLVLSLANGIPRLGRLELAVLESVLGRHRPAALSINERLGDAGFASLLRVAVAGLVLAGRARPAWAPAPHLAAAGFAPFTTRPRTALVTAMAGGGSCLAAVLAGV
ncbi:MAG TPA: beta-ketoacyl synthase N-terminal-like domain-containing protein [Thermoanaerobaculaceae bacterium]|nr:beta-ketoacyl synthase N-terminal-like domain-containing protein [Thermoanaerobaculaceae bacterium]HRS16871.1 beta-ketoacyl synthase N-terminal-like domain-containing protein [Thermoanaerobaculaceae bacterium]